MKCPKCKKTNVEDSKYCQFCGSKLVIKTKPEDIKENSKTDAVWDKFGTIYDSKDEERKKYMDLTSSEAWELIGNLSKINFESFIEENKTELNKYPYRILDSLENKYYWCLAGGYLGWIAEALVNGVKLGEVTVSKDNLFKDWQKNWLRISLPRKLPKKRQSSLSLFTMLPNLTTPLLQKGSRQ